MATIETAPVLARLRELGHNYSPDKQGYKASIAQHKCVLYDPNSKADDGGAAAVTVKASDIEQFIDKGFLVERPEVARGRRG